MDYDEEIGTHESDPRINERIRESFGLEETVSHKPIGRTEGRSPQSPNLELATKILSRLDTPYFGKREYLPKETLLEMARSIRRTGVVLRSGYSRMDSHDLYGYLNSVKKSIEIGRARAS